MIRIFLPPADLTSEQVTITGENARHLALVLKVQPGERLSVMDGKGFRYECKVVSVQKKEVSAEVIKKEAYSVESPLSITLAQGMAKGEKMDLIVQESTELGVSRIIPVITDRSQVRHTHKTERWRKIAMSASQQSGRNLIPYIENPVIFSEFIDRFAPPHAKGYVEDIKGIRLENGTGIIFSEGREETNLRKILSGMKGIKQLTILIGPEGGFSKDEVSSAKEHGFIEASLGPRILRTGTAPISALSIIQYELGDMNA